MLTGTVVLLLLAGIAVLVGQRHRDHALPPFPEPVSDPDHDPRGRPADVLPELLGPVPPLTRRFRAVALLKFLGNEYWQEVSRGMLERAAELHLAMDIRAAPREQAGEAQLVMLREILDGDYDLLIVAPVTHDNLAPALWEAREAGIPVVHLSETCTAGSNWFTGPNHENSGRLAARHLASVLPRGAQVAIVQGMADVYAADQRTRGFVTEAQQQAGLQVRAQPVADWDMEKAMQATKAILAEHPQVAGIYCHCDGMALGVLHALVELDLHGQVRVVGNGGIDSALDAMRSGALNATVDTQPVETGRIATDVAARILSGQNVPAVVYTPQRLMEASELAATAASPRPAPTGGTP